MTVEDLKKFFKADLDFVLAEKLGVTKGTVSNWRHRGIPPERQALIQLQTNGALIAVVPPLRVNK